MRLFLHLILVIIACKAIFCQEHFYHGDQHSARELNQNTSELFFSVISPNQIQPNENYTALIILEDSNHPVTFNLSIIEGGTFPVSPTLVTLEADNTKLVTINTPIPSQNISTQENLQLLLSAYSADRMRFRNKFHLTQKHTSSKKIFIQTNKRDFVVGETIHYRIVVFDSISRQPVRWNESLEVHLTQTNSHTTDEATFALKPNNNSSEFVYIGNITAAERYTKLIATFPAENLKESRSFSVMERRLSFFKVQSESQDIFYPETMFRVNLSFLTKEESLPVDGQCKLHISLDGEDFEGAVKRTLLQNVTMTYERQVQTLEFNLENKTEAFGKYKSVDIKTSAFCVHTSGIKSKAIESKKLYLKDFFQFKLKNELILPVTTQKYTPILVDLIVSRKGGIPFQLDDLKNALQVTLNCSRDQDELNDIYQFSFDSTPPNGTFEVEFHIQDEESALECLHYSELKVEFGNSVETFTTNSYDKMIRWNHLPHFNISLIDSNISINAGDVAKFQLVTSDHSLKEVKLNAVLYSSKGVISSSRQIIEMKKNEGGLLEIKIPGNISEPLVVYLTVIGKYPYGCMQTWPTRIEKCFLKTSISFLVNIPKPILRLNNIKKTNHINELLLEISGGSKNIQHVSFELSSESKHTYLTTYYINSYKDEFMNEGNKREESMSIYSNGPGLTHGWRRAHLMRPNIQFFEFSNFTVNNGTLQIPISLDSREYIAEYTLKAIVVSDNAGGIVYTNEINLYIPPPAISIHIPFLPETMTLGEMVQINGLFKNNSPDNITDVIYFEICGADSEKRNLDLLTIKSESYVKFQMLLGPEIASLNKFRIWSDDGPTIVKTINVVPEGRQVKISQTLLIETTVNLSSVIPAGCNFSSGESIGTTNYSSDIFGDLRNALHENSRLIDVGKSSSAYINWLCILTILMSTQKGSDFKNMKEYFSQLELSAVHKLLDGVPTSSLFLLENYAFALSLFNNLQTESFTKFNVTDILNAQNPDGSFIVPEQESSEESGSTELLESTFVETIFGLLALNYSSINAEEKDDIERQTSLGLTFIEHTIQEVLESSSMTIDNYQLSIGAYLFSKINHPLCFKLLTRLKQKASIDSHGLFWTSDWKESDSRNFSIATTAYALMAYINLEQDDSLRIAQWLVAQRNNYGMYDSLSDTSLVMRSLSLFQERSSPLYSLQHFTGECYVPLKNSTHSLNFNFTKSFDPTDASLMMYLCLFSNISQQVSITLPTKYVFVPGEVFQPFNNEVPKSNYNFLFRGPFSHITNLNRRISFEVNEEELVHERCFCLKAHKLFRITVGFFALIAELASADFQPPVVVEVNSITHPEHKGVGTFALT